VEIDITSLPVSATADHLDSRGTVLTRLNPGDHVDSATLEFAAGI
jgi:hypothetical protein